MLNLLSEECTSLVRTGTLQSKQPGNALPLGQSCQAKGIKRHQTRCGGLKCWDGLHQGESLHLAVDVRRSAGRETGAMPRL